MVDIIEVKKVCGICAHFPTVPVHCYVNDKKVNKSHPPCDLFELHARYRV